MTFCWQELTWNYVLLFYLSVKVHRYYADNITITIALPCFSYFGDIFMLHFTMCFYVTWPSCKTTWIRHCLHHLARNNLCFYLFNIHLSILFYVLVNVMWNWIQICVGKTKLSISTCEDKETQICSKGLLCEIVS